MKFKFFFIARYQTDSFFYSLCEPKKIGNEKLGRSMFWMIHSFSVLCMIIIIIIIIIKIDSWLYLSRVFHSNFESTIIIFSSISFSVFFSWLESFIFFYFVQSSSSSFPITRIIGHNPLIIPFTNFFFFEYLFFLGCVVNFSVFFCFVFFHFYLLKNTRYYPNWPLTFSIKYTEFAQTFIWTCFFLSTFIVNFCFFSCCQQHPTDDKRKCVWMREREKKKNFRQLSVAGNMKMKKFF